MKKKVKSTVITKVLLTNTDAEHRNPVDVFSPVPVGLLVISFMTEEIMADPDSLHGVHEHFSVVDFCLTLFDSLCL